MGIIGKVTVTEVCQAVVSRFEQSISGVRGQALGDMTESIPDTPLVQVYFEGIRSQEEQVKQVTFKGGVQPVVLTMHVDVFSSRRAHIGEDMEKMTQKVDEVISVLQAEGTKPYFGVKGLESFGWRAERAVIEYGDKDYVGSRFVLEFVIF